MRERDTETGNGYKLVTELLHETVLESHSTKLEQTLVCKYDIGISYILGTWSFADSNTLGGSLSLQPFSITRPDDGGAAKPLLLSNPMALVLSGTRMDVQVLSTSKDQSLDVLRFTCGCGGRDLFSFT